MIDAFRWAKENDPDNQITVIFEQGNNMLIVAVSDEMAVDSYNSHFETSIELPLEEAKRLRIYLNGVLPQ